MQIEMHARINQFTCQEFHRRFFTAVAKTLRLSLASRKSNAMIPAVPAIIAAGLQ